MKKTADEVAAEVAALKAIRPQVVKVVPRTAFGDSNVDSIDAEIKALEKGWTDDDAYDTYDSDSESDSRKRNSALDAIAWRDGESEDDEAPSKGWQDLIASRTSK